MAIRDTPKLEDVLPPEAIAFAEAASLRKEKPPTQTASIDVSEKYTPQEGKVAAPLRLAPSVQQRIRRLIFIQSERGGRRVTAQDFMESAILDRLEREEKKL
ncbi:hypothetical protein [Sulfurirhabdus autotrophica]|uniref:Uncharacterized protein n=1 Tax=Sulfurirhabdus autotrophica TaxID=1706046 RepID=A0A4R3XSR2_9PROT|nr:hypothetical protein [Sulfurirhabdus autotrophica]TCV82695.1 hypothetical protein EDC63_11912 [Sulfurirhabdus autotrophica]